MKSSTKSCSWDGTTLGSSPEERAWGSWGAREGKPLLQSCPAESKPSPAQHLGGHIWTQIQLQGPHNPREMPANWRHPKEQGHTTAKERWRELGLLSLEKEKPQEESDGNLPLPKKWWGQEQDGIRPFSKVHGKKQKQGIFSSVQQGEFL